MRAIQIVQPGEIKPVDDAKLALARRLGAAFTVNSKTENVHERLQAITRNCGPDVVLEAVGAPVTYQTAVNEVAFSGRVVCIGYAKTEIAFETKQFVQKELDIRGSRNALPEDFRAVMEYLKHGTCPKEELISGIYAPDQVGETMKNWTADETLLSAKASGLINERVIALGGISPKTIPHAAAYGFGGVAVLGAL
jgi:threonine dehydrogenase-like Zn-dependent dehydrogenase